MYLYTFLKKDPSIFESILECLVLIDYALFHVSFIKVVDWISYSSDFFLYPAGYWQNFQPKTSDMILILIAGYLIPGRISGPFLALLQ